MDLTVVSLLPDQAGTSSVTVMFLMFALPYFHKVIPGALTNKKTCQNQTNGLTNCIPLLLRLWSDLVKQGDLRPLSDSSARSSPHSLSLFSNAF